MFAQELSNLAESINRLYILAFRHIFAKLTLITTGYPQKSSNMSIDKPLLAAAKGQKPSRTPIWFLRQAGRYLPEYREIRSNFEFVDLCKSPKDAAEVTLQPLRRFDLDAAIIFSDILIPCIALGQELTFGKGHGPQLSEPVRDAATLGKLSVPSDVAAAVGYVGEAIAKTKSQLNPQQTMIGFCGAPFTVASYMIEGAGSKNYTEVKKLLFKTPEVFHGLMEMITEISISYLKMQIDAGAEYIMLFDTWANQVPAQDYRNSNFPYVQRLAQAVKGFGVPVAYFPGQGCNMIHELEGLEIDVLHVDWRARLSRARKILDEISLDVAIQGNLDPQTFLGEKEFVMERTREVLREGQGAKGHIFNIGHGLLPITPPDALTWAIEAVRTYSGD